MNQRKENSCGALDVQRGADSEQSTRLPAPTTNSPILHAGGHPYLLLTPFGPDQTDRFRPKASTFNQVIVR